jgi:hypothetical protein
MMKKYMHTMGEGQHFLYEDKQNRRRKCIVDLTAEFSEAENSKGLVYP